MPGAGKRFEKGNPGRPKGAKNKLTRTLREAIELSFDRRGSVEYLMKLDDREYVGLLGKLLPLQIEGGDPNKPVVMRWQNESESDSSAT